MNTSTVPGHWRGRITHLNEIMKTTSHGHYQQPGLIAYITRRENDHIIKMLNFGSILNKVS